MSGPRRPCARTQAAELFIDDLAVRADRQRRGVGRALIGTLRTAAADAGVPTLFVRGRGAGVTPGRAAAGDAAVLAG